MGLGIEAVKEIADEFVREYWNEKFNDYLTGVSVSKIDIQKRRKKNNVTLREGESLDDLCLWIFLRKEPPEDIKALLPDDYKGARVFYEISGDISISLS